MSDFRKIRRVDIISRPRTAVLKNLNLVLFKLFSRPYMEAGRNFYPNGICFFPGALYITGRCF